MNYYYIIEIATKFRSGGVQEMPRFLPLARPSRNSIYASSVPLRPRLGAKERTMTSTKRTWIKRLLSTAAMATVAVGLLGAAAPTARADNDDWRWRQNNWYYYNHHNWNGGYYYQNYYYRP